MTAALPLDAAPQRPRTVLVAEDDLELRTLIVDELRRDGYEVLTVANGAELFDFMIDAICSDSEPDVIVSDIRMPGFSGLDVLKHLKTAESRAPVVLITAFPTEETLDRARKLGATARLGKPFDLDDLRSAVAAVHH
jgi:CheY-like chemotaxis protein